MHLTSGTPVTAGQALLEIGNTQVMEAVVDVLSSDAIRVTPGTPVRLSYGMGAQPMTGRVSRIEPVAFTKISALGIEEQRVNVVVELDTPADSTRSLGEGFRVDAHITLTAHDQVLLVPSAALIREGLGWQVMLYKNGRAHSQSITVKERNADTAWVESGDRAGVQEGDWVLLYPGTIASGQRIRLKPTRPGQ